MENIKTQIEIFCTSVSDINMSSMPLDSSLFMTSKVIYQLLRPLLELSAEIKQFAEQGQLSWKQDAYSQTDVSGIRRKNASTQTPSVSGVSGREIRRPTRYHVSHDSDSENEGRKVNKRKRKHTVSWLNRFLSLMQHDNTYGLLWLFVCNSFAISSTYQRYSR